MTKSQPPAVLKPSDGGGGGGGSSTRAAPGGAGTHQRGPRLQGGCGMQREGRWDGHEVLTTDFQAVLCAVGDKNDKNLCRWWRQPQGGEFLSGRRQQLFPCKVKTISPPVLNRSCIFSIAEVKTELSPLAALRSNAFPQALTANCHFAVSSQGCFLRGGGGGAPCNEKGS